MPPRIMNPISLGANAVVLIAVQRNVHNCFRAPLGRKSPFYSRFPISKLQQRGAVNDDVLLQYN